MRRIAFLSLAVTLLLGLLTGGPPARGTPAVAQDLGTPAGGAPLLSLEAWGAGLLIGTADGRLLRWEGSVTVDLGRPLAGAVRLRALAVSPAGEAFVGGDQGARVARIPGGALGGEAFEEREVHSLLWASDGSLYGGTGPHGRLVRWRGSWEDLGRTGLEATVVALAEGPDGIYGGTDEGHLFRYEPSTGRTVLLKELPAPVQDLRGKGARIWILAGDRLWIWEGGRLDLWAVLPDRGTALLDLPDGSLLVGLYPGARLAWVPARGQVQLLGTAVSGEETVVDLALGSDGRAYGITYEGGHLFALDLPTSTPTPSAGCPDPFEGDDGRSQASLLTAGALQNHTFDRPGDEDWVQIQVPEMAQIWVGVSQLTGGAEPAFALYDETGQLVAEGRNRWKGSAPTLNQVVPAGTYFLRFWEAGDGWGCQVGYAVTWQWSSVTPTPTPFPTPTPVPVLVRPSPRPAPPRLTPTPTPTPTPTSQHRIYLPAVFHGP